MHVVGVEGVVGVVLRDARRSVLLDDRFSGERPRGDPQLLVRVAPPELVAQHAQRIGHGDLTVPDGPGQHMGNTSRALFRHRRGDQPALLVLKRVDTAAQEEHGVVEHGERFGLGLRRALRLLVEAAFERVQRSHRGGGHEPRTERVRRLAEIVRDRLEQQLVDASHRAALEVRQPLVLAAQALAQVRRVLLGRPLVEHRVDPAPERVEGGLAGEAVAQRACQAVEVTVDVVEDDRFLRREVGEERARRDVGRGGDVGDGRGVIAALGEQAHGRVDDLLARALLLAFPQPLRHVPIVANDARYVKKHP